MTVSRNMNTPRDGLTVMQARGKVIPDAMCASQLHPSQPGAGCPDTEGARAASFYKSVSPGAVEKPAGCWHRLHPRPYRPASGAMPVTVQAGAFL